jgi:Tol biopolymer transport system component
MFLFWALRRGYQLLRDGKSDAALEYFSQLKQRYPNAVEPLFEIGKLQFKRGDIATARQSFIDVVNRHPSPEIITGILEMTNWLMVSSPSFFNSEPRFSPDGQQLLFCSARQDTNGDGKIDATDRAGIYLADLAHGGVKEVISNVYHNAGPVWAPNGKSFLYFSSRPFELDHPVAGDAGHRQLMLRELETQEDSLVIPASLNPRYPAFTPDGKRIVVCTVDTIDGPSGLSVVDLETMVRRSLTSHAWEHTFPQISSDGQWLLYVSWRGASGRNRLDANSAVYLMNLSTEKEKILVSNQYSNAFPRFSPSGDSIVFLSRRRDTNEDGRIDQLDNFGVYTLNLSNHKEVCVASDKHYNKFPGWSPDQKWILFLSHYATQKKRLAWQGDAYFEFKGIYRAPLAGGEPKIIVSDKFFGSRYCEIAPQGNLVAYVSWRPTGNRGLYIADYLNPPSLDQLRGFIQNNLS